MTSQLYNTSMHSDSFYDVISNDFVLIQDINDERFGLVSLVKSKSTSRFLLVKNRYERNSSYHLMSDISQSLEMLDTNFLMVYDIKPDPVSNTLKIYFEHFPTDLAQQIRIQKRENKAFSEEELYAILHGVLGGLACLERNRRSHDFIAPMNIFRIDAETYKISDNYIISEPKSLYQQVLKGHSSRYIAPELVRDLEYERSIPCEYDVCKADIFSLGMSILDAGLLGIKGTFIHPHNKEFDEALLEKAIAKFEKYYSTSLTDILREMLCVNVSRRPNASSLLSRISSQSVTGTPVKSRDTERSIYKVVGNYSLVSSRNVSMYSEAFKTPSKEIFYSTFPGATPALVSPNGDILKDTNRTYEMYNTTGEYGGQNRPENQLYAKPNKMLSDYFGSTIQSNSTRKSVNSHSTFRNTFQSTEPLPFEVLSQSQYSRMGLEQDSERLPSFFGDKDRLRIYHLEEIKNANQTRLPSKPGFEHINSYHYGSNLKSEQKETALNRIIEESLERSRANIEMVQQDLRGPDGSNITFSIDDVLDVKLTESHFVSNSLLDKRLL